MLYSISGAREVGATYKPKLISPDIKGRTHIKGV
jgi:hypothetical protein